MLKGPTTVVTLGLEPPTSRVPVEQLGHKVIGFPCFSIMGPKIPHGAET